MIYTTLKIWPSVDCRSKHDDVLWISEHPAKSLKCHNELKHGNKKRERVGTNLGFYSLLFSKLVEKRGRVLGFEPLTFHLEAASKSVTENQFSQCSVHNVALGSERGAAQIIYAPRSTNWGGAFLSFDGVGLPDHVSVPVPVAPLSDFVEGIPTDFIKIDVEGAEYLVLGGCREYLAQEKPIVMSEIHCRQLERVSGVSAAEYIKLMNELGYTCYEIGMNGKLGRKLIGNESFFPRQTSKD